MIHIYCCTSCRELLKTSHAFSLTTKPSSGAGKVRKLGWWISRVPPNSLMWYNRESSLCVRAAILKAVQKLLNLLQGPRSHQMLKHTDQTDLTHHNIPGGMRGRFILLKHVSSSLFLWPPPFGKDLDVRKGHKWGKSGSNFWEQGCTPVVAANCSVAFMRLMMSQAWTQQSTDIIVKLNALSVLNATWLLMSFETTDQ